MIILDTNVISEYYRDIRDKKRSNVVENIESKSFGVYATCSIIIAEILAGIKYLELKHGEASRLRSFYSIFLEQIPCIYFTNETGEIFSQIKSKLQTRGTPVADTDIMIASCVISIDGTLITKNTKDFEKIATVSELKYKSWG